MSPNVSHLLQKKGGLKPTPHIVLFRMIDGSEGM